MTREEKSIVIDDLTARLNQKDIIYLADTSGLDSKATSNLRRDAFKSNVTLSVVKNTLLLKAMEKVDKNFGDLPATLTGSTSILLSENANLPAKLIKSFRKKFDKPVLKGAYIREDIYIGDDQLDILERIKSKEELIGDVIALLESPINNVVLALQSAGSKLSAILKTLSEK